MHRGWAGSIALVLLGSLVGCGGDGPPPGSGRYVALGDSFVSGPAISKQDPNALACLRSDRNYPSLVAKQLKWKEFVDVSCGGATTETMRSGRVTAQGESIRPQLDALTVDTDLVTVGVGGNDEGAATNLFTFCLIKATATDAKCRAFSAAYVKTVEDSSRDRVRSILSEIKGRAPEAKIFLVGYLRIVPDQGDCPDLPMSETSRAAAMEVEKAFGSALKSAARAADVPFIDVRPGSRGHDACAGQEAWVNGIENPPGDGAFLHPNAAGMRYVAKAVEKALERS
ncbi:SGNH/GDSL hydrolase family protein [Aeromicrobium sp.]|uniref:SGNH/GDSL hydrolase family protein n=1 Tax=Aeromicrobium sp. TaxID=1871063 RepID=UPI0030BADB04